MRAMIIDESAPGTLIEADVPAPDPGPGQVLVEVAAAGVNRADLLQLAGLHPPPAGAPSWPGLEVSGRVVAAGEGVDPALMGAAVAALVDGGGYAELCLAHADDLVVLPDGYDVVAAGGLPEAVATAYSNLTGPGGLDPRDNTGRTVLVHGGSGGVGSIAIQWLRATGAVVFATAGGPDRAARCDALGAYGIDHRSEDFVRLVREATGERGVDVILDVVGAAYLERNVSALAEHGRLVIIGMQKGTTGEVNLAPLLFGWRSIHGTVLRNRTRDEKAGILADVRRDVLPLIERGQVRVIEHERLPLAEAARAHAAMAAGEVFGKVLLLP
ncbi:zinc-binding dehydrogenase [Pseudactinotalea sp. HY158]|uniref:zinc-binding dehydrogenase n=1 Tax=Pseudactinotalea sp. HY158 TaxID=2654547 RepID=UPI00129C3ABD|nr:zinc-binding dehydrogenase [Pseudactinotalea sp. HY158]QGH68278.1 zinc-binding dehydrogenase [Pseudactinotalea sp. HY158]